jgi:hypothetical protein
MNEKLESILSNARALEYARSATDTAKKNYDALVSQLEKARARFEDAVSVQQDIERKILNSVK